MLHWFTLVLPLFGSTRACGLFHGLMLSSISHITRRDSVPMCRIKAVYAATDTAVVLHGFVCACDLIGPNHHLEMQQCSVLCMYFDMAHLPPCSNSYQHQAPFLFILWFSVQNPARKPCLAYVCTGHESVYGASQTNKNSVYKLQVFT